MSVRTAHQTRSASTKIRLYCIPSAGCGPSMYRNWARGQQGILDIRGVGIPGRESLMRETLLTRLDKIVENLSIRLSEQPRAPYALFGHSMGAWIAFELCRKFRREGLSLPVHLFVSARRAPQTDARWPPLSELPDDQLLEELQRRYDGLPEEVLANKELLDIALPVIRADLLAVESYIYSPEPPLSCPISCYGGQDDAWVPSEDLNAWSAQTAGKFELQMFSGGHFYLQEAAEAALLNAIQSTLSSSS